MTGLLIAFKSIFCSKGFRASNLSLDAHYYISRVLIPPLDRIFSLMGADVRQWFDDMARPILLDPSSPSKKGNEADVLDVVNNINGHLVASVCAVCAAPALEGKEGPC